MRPNKDGGHGPFSAEQISQIMTETGYDYDTVCRDIDQTQATTKEQLYPQFYSGEGIQPQTAAAVAPTAPTPTAAVPMPADGVGAPPAVAPSGNQTPVTESDSLPPEALAAMHAGMAPPDRTPPPTGPKSDPAWRRRVAGRQRY